jgi:perosamine synthetase
MDAVMNIARSMKLMVIEDAAESPGAEYRGRKVGSIGDVGCFSFHNKLIATGEGGLIATNSEAVFFRAEALRNPAPDNRTTFPEISLNCRMSNLQAAVGVAQLERLDNIIAKKRQIASVYDQALSNRSDVEIVAEDAWARSVYWRYSILLSKQHAGMRDGVVAALNELGIAARGVFYPMHLHPYYREATQAAFPRAESVSSRGIDLPTSPKLSSEELQYITQSLASVLTKHSEREPYGVTRSSVA